MGNFFSELNNKFRRKNESINQLNLLHLLSERMLTNSQSLTIPTYNVLFEILTEQMYPDIRFDYQRHPELESPTVRFENPALLKVIALLIEQSTESEELLQVKRIFLEDLIRMCKEMKENRR